MSDIRVETWTSKQVAFDYDIMVRATAEFGGYNYHCLTPQASWLLTTMLSVYGGFLNRFENFPSERDIDQLVTDAMEGLNCPVTCEEDFLVLIAAVQGIGLTLIEIRDRLGDEEADIDVKIETVATAVDELATELGGFGLPELIDKLEPILNGVGIILGAPDVPLNGA